MRSEAGLKGGPVAFGAAEAPSAPRTRMVTVTVRAAPVREGRRRQAAVVAVEATAGAPLPRVAPSVWEVPVQMRAAPAARCGLAAGATEGREPTAGAASPARR